RLNFTTAITNATFTANSFPTLSVGSEGFFTSGSTVTLDATAADADGDALRFGRYQPADLWQQFLLSAGLSLSFPFTQSLTNPFSFVAPTLGRPASVHYPVSVSDGRGGGATGANLVTVPRADALAPPLTAAL